MKMVEVMEHMKGGYRDKADLVDLRLDYDVRGVKIDRMVKAWHLAGEWYELYYDPELPEIIRCAWLTAEMRDGVPVIEVRGEGE